MIESRDRVHRPPSPAALTAVHSAGDREPALRLLPGRLDGRDAAELILLCGAAYLGNLLAAPLFFGVDLLFGGVAVMFTVLRRSLAEAVLVAAVGSIYTIVLWHHPYALVIFVLEAAAVHFALRWSRHEITLHDALFWVVLGTPLVVLFYAGPLAMEARDVALIALKQSVNGVFYTACASLLHHGLLLRRPGARLGTAHAADLLAPVLVCFALLPSLAVLAVDARLTQRRIQTDAAAHLASAGLALRESAALDPASAGDLHAQLERLEPRPEALALALVRPAGTVAAEAPEGWLTRRPDVEPASEGVVRRIPRGGGLPAMTRAHRSYYASSLAGRDVTTPSELELVIGTPAAPYVEELRARILASLAIAALIGVLGAIGASLVARFSGRLLHPLMQRLESVPERIRSGERPPWPRSAVAELAELTRSARRMEDDLAEQVDALSASEQRLRGITENLPGGVHQQMLGVDGDLRFTYLSHGFEDLFAVDREAARKDAGALLERIHPDDRQAYLQAVQRSARTLEPLEAGFRLVGPGGTLRWLRSLARPRSNGEGTVVWDGITIDETARVQAEGKLAHLARYDGLTGVLTREAFVAHLEPLLRDGAGAAPSLLFVDLNHVKALNDAFGHAAGDELIRRAAGRIEAAAGPRGQVGRYGGDQFVLATQGIADEEAARRLIGAVLEQLRVPLSISGHELEPLASVGVLLRPEAGDDAHECLRKAAVALHDAKRRGPGRSSFYSEAMDDERRRRTALVPELRVALATDQLFLEYQPKVDLGQRRARSVEALVRWRHPVQGVLAPGLFVPVAEEAGLIDDLGCWVLRRACADLRAWQQAAADAPEHVSVNVSGRQLQGDALWDAIWGALKAYGLEARHLELEVTESAFYDGDSGILERLHAAGIRLAIDDYGKGYSSLFTLRDTPAQVVKIDRSFVAHALTSPTDRAIVESTVSLAHALGKSTVAEGVESPEQLAMLEALGSDMVQGYYLAPPTAAENVVALCQRAW